MVADRPEEIVTDLSLLRDSIVSSVVGFDSWRINLEMMTER
jgi:hypothetical protein